MLYVKSNEIPSGFLIRKYLVDLCASLKINAAIIVASTDLNNIAAILQLFYVYTHYPRISTMSFFKTSVRQLSFMALDLYEHKCSAKWVDTYQYSLLTLLQS